MKKMKILAQSFMLIMMFGLSQGEICAGAVVSTVSKPVQTLTSKEVSGFHKKFVSWKKTLTPKEIQSCGQLFGQYDELYRKYKAKPKSAYGQKLLALMHRALQELMDNWPMLKTHI